MKIKRMIIGAVVAGGALGVSSIAMAAFTGDGTFSVTGKAATAAPVTAYGTIVSPLMPGYWSDAELTVSNPNPFPVVIDQVLPLTAQYGDSGIVNPLTCTTAFQIGYDLSSYGDGVVGTSSAAGTEIPAGGSAHVVLPDAIGMSQGATNACQGASVELPLKVTFNVAAGNEALGF